MAKNLPEIQETHVQYLVGEDPLEKGMAIHSSVSNSLSDKFRGSVVMHGPFVLAL